MHPDRFELCRHCGNVGRVREDPDCHPGQLQEQPLVLADIEMSVSFDTADICRQLGDHVIESCSWVFPNTTRYDTVLGRGA